MTNNVQAFLKQKAQQKLPSRAYARGGACFNPQSDKWNFRDQTTKAVFDFTCLPENLTPLIHGIKVTLSWYLEHRNLNTARGKLSAVCWFGKALQQLQAKAIHEITISHILSLKAANNKNEYRLAELKPFLMKWCELHAPGIDRGIIDNLKNIKLKQNPVGVAVATLDPNKGPLSDLEFEDLQIGLKRALAENIISTEKYLICCLIVALGVRPIQIASLKCKDLIPADLDQTEHIINIPSVKQTRSMNRASFKPRMLNNSITQNLLLHIKNVQSRFKDKAIDPGELPMFPIEKQHKFRYSEGYVFHATASAIVQKANKTLKSLELNSERLNTGTPIFCLRLRRTFATRAAEEGWSDLVIAELMDHRDTRHVKVYAGLTTRVRAKFSRKIALDMAPLAKAFSGQIITNESTASRPDPSSRIIDLRIDSEGSPLASCGCTSNCGFARPFACYAGCLDFEPWLDGPHEAALDYMLAKREKLLESADERIASINDRSILGCAQIILRCREIKRGNTNDK